MSSLALLLAPFTGHNPDIATFILSEAEQGWSLWVSVSGAALDWVLTQNTPESGWSEETVRAACLDAVSTGVHLVADGHPWTLGPGEVRLGTHQSTFRFDLGEHPGFSSLQGTRVDALSQVPNQHNVLRVVRGEDVQQWVLAERNGYAVAE